MMVYVQYVSYCAATEEQLKSRYNWAAKVLVRSPNVRANCPIVHNTALGYAKDVLAVYRDISLIFNSGTSDKGHSE